MTDLLFKQLLDEIENFFYLCNLVPRSLSEEWKEKYPNEKITEQEKGFWSNELPQKLRPRYEKLKIFIKNNPEENLKDIDIYMEKFRQLSRFISEGPCYWSTYYKEIKTCLRNMSILMIQIDRKYYLGQHHHDKRRQEPERNA